jgi:hypothetical protein
MDSAKILPESRGHDPRYVGYSIPVGVAQKANPPLLPLGHIHVSVGGRANHTRLREILGEDSDAKTGREPELGYPLSGNVSALRTDGGVFRRYGNESAG